MSQLFTSSTIPLSFEPHDGHNTYNHRKPPPTGNDPFEEVEGAPLWQYMLAGGLGGVVGDSAMHSLDTVKTRQQGFPYNKKYKNMIPAYRTILKEEGFSEVYMVGTVLLH